MASTSRGSKITDPKSVVHNTNCCVYGCHSKKGKDRNIHFHYFPKKNSGISVKIVNAMGQEEKIDKRKVWEKVLLMGKPVTESMRVCSKHFKNEDYCAKGLKLKQPKLNKFAVPSQNLPKKSFEPEDPKVKSGDLREKRLAKRRKVREDIVRSVTDTPMCEGDADCIEYEPTARSYEELSEEERVAVQNLLSLGSARDPFYVDQQVQVSSGDILNTFVSTIKQESHLNSLTGINSFEVLDSLPTLVKKFYPDRKTHKLSVKERIVLVFMKLKMAMKLNVLSFLFKIAPTSCKLIFVKYVGCLANILKSCIHWPSFKECQQNMPTCFREFKTVRIVLDCLEIPIEKPKCLCCRVRTYSHYKGRQTIKLMTGVSPAGLITFLSKCYGGRSSDKAIFSQSHLLDELTPRQDSVMVDKGFLIDEICSEHFIKIIRPHFLRKKKQFTETESKENILISRARVHIERVNQRIRIFNILNSPLPISLIPSIDNIMTVICGMVNLQTPILAQNRF